MPSQKSQSEQKEAERKAAEQNQQNQQSQNDGDGGDPSDNNATPAEDAAASANESVLRGGTPTDEDSDDKDDEPSDSVAHEEVRGAEPGDENYSPYKDPDVPSSAVAEQIARELAGSGESRTLDGIREQKKAAEKK